MSKITSRKPVPLLICILIGLIYWPIALLWSAVYGSLGGIFYKMVATFEGIQGHSCMLILKWRKYPTRSYDNYIHDKMEAYFASSNPSPTHRGVRRASLLQELSQTYVDQPYPYMPILKTIFLQIIILPFRLVIGALKGPVYLFEKSKWYWRITFLGKNPMEKYLKQLEKEKVLQQKYRKHRPVATTGL